MGLKFTDRSAGDRWSVGIAAALLASTAMTCVSLTLSTPASAQTAQTSYSIPGGPLNRVLAAFGRQSGLQIVYVPAIAAGKSSPGVSGAASPAQAVASILQGTGLTYSFPDSRTVSIAAPSTAATGVGALPAGAIPLDTIDVQGAGNPNSTMTPMPAYAGGQVATGGQVGMLGNRSVMNTPFSQTSYTNKTIQDQQAQTVQDVLANDPSVVSTPASVAYGFTSDTIRGFISNTRYAGGRSLNGLPDMAPRVQPTMDFIDRVEVLKGPSAVLNGMAAAGHTTGGTVNLTTKMAGDEPLTQLTTRYMNRSQFGANVDIGRRFGNNKEFGVRVNGTLSGGDTAVIPQRSEVGSIALNLDYRGERIRVAADFAHLAEEGNSGGSNHLDMYLVPSVPKVPDSHRSLFPSWTKWQSTSTLGMVRGEVDISDNVTAYAAIGAQRFDWRSTGAIQPILQDTSGRYSLALYRLREPVDVLSMQGGVRANVATGPVAHALSINLSQSRFERSGAYPTSGTMIVNSIYNPVFGPAPLLPDPVAPQKTNESKMSSVGIADTLSIFEERIQFTAGVRYQQVEAANFDTMTGARTSSYDSMAWTPTFALVVKPWENVSLYANYIEGLQQGTTVSNFYANAGQVLPPYVSKQSEAGVKVDWGRVTTTLAMFQITFPSTISIPNAGGGLPTLALGGEQRNRGLELNAYGELFEGVRLLSGVTWIDARQTKTANGAFDGERAQQVPAFRAVVGGEWDTPFINGLTLSGRVTYTSDQVVTNNRPHLTIPSWTTLDLGARYTFASPWNAKPVTIRFNVDNVFDKNYWRTAGGNYLSAGEPRTYRLSTTFNF